MYVLKAQQLMDDFPVVRSILACASTVDYESLAALCYSLITSTSPTIAIESVDPLGFPSIIAEGQRVISQWENEIREIQRRGAASVNQLLETLSDKQIDLSSPTFTMFLEGFLANHEAVLSTAKQELLNLPAFPTEKLASLYCRFAQWISGTRSKVEDFESTISLNSSLAMTIATFLNVASCEYDAQTTSCLNELYYELESGVSAARELRHQLEAQQQLSLRMSRRTRTKENYDKINELKIQLRAAENQQSQIKSG